MNPSLFISHGAPNMILGNSFTKKNIKTFANTLENPKYIIVVSAHWTTKDLKIINYETKGLMYDFYGFEDELYNYKYEINSQKNISLEILKELEKQDINIEVDTNRNTYDHGVWSTLAMMYEELHIPVIQLSIPLNYSIEQLINLGEKLQVFKKDALIIGSGGLTHNLSDMSVLGEVKKYAKDFNDFVVEAMKSGNKQKLLEIKNLNTFYQNHPSPEHFLPLYIIYGSAINKKAKSFNHEITYTNLSMECFAFDKKE